ncbi:MAG TPA: transcriptional regulator [Opitutales bacterium]|nr:transcriptional regulator [Opitutales bacterium]
MPENPFASLSRVMHEPNRLALVSALAAAVDGLSFNDLKAACDLTDGNLNRHLKALEEDGIIAQNKQTMRGGRPRTTISLTPAGRRRFVKYLENLEEVLAHAAAAVGAAAPTHSLPVTRPLRA